VTNWTTGKTADLSGNSQTGQLINLSTSTSPTQGKIGGALTFNGFSSYIDGGNFADNLGEMTVSAWIKTSSTTQNGVIVSKISKIGSALAATGVVITSAVD